MNYFTYISSNISSTEVMSTYTLQRHGMLLTGNWSYGSLIYPLKIKQDFFQAVAMSILLLNGGTTWTLKKHIEKRLDGNYSNANTLSWTNPKNSSCMATNHSHKTNKTCRALLEKQLRVMFSYRLLHMDVPMLVDLQRLPSAICRYKTWPRRPAWRDRG